MLLLIPVPEADWLVRGRGSVLGDAVGAHLLLGHTPALDDGDLAELTDLFADVVPFSFSLDEVCRFPGGGVYLAPQPPAPLRRLTLAVDRSLPAHPEMRVDEVVPHVSVPLREGEGTDDVERLLIEHGPLVGHAREAHLVDLDAEGGVRVVARFSFGTTAA